MASRVLWEVYACCDSLCFNVFISDLEKARECILIITANDNKLWGWRGFTSLRVLRIRVDKALSSLVWHQSWPCPEQEIGLEASSGPFQPKLSYQPVSLDAVLLPFQKGCSVPLQISTVFLWLGALVRHSGPQQCDLWC